MQKESIIPIESKIVQKEIRILNESKAAQETDLSVKVLKENIRFFFRIHNQNTTKLQKQPLEAFCEKKVFLEFTRKHLCYSLYFNKTTGLRAATEPYN